MVPSHRMCCSMYLYDFTVPVSLSMLSAGLINRTSIGGGGGGENVVEFIYRLFTHTIDVDTTTRPYTMACMVGRLLA